jgi:ABC-type uncharacterized transport system permease subunit
LDKQKKTQKPDVGKIFVEELTNTGPKARKRGTGYSFLIAILAIFTGLVIGAIFIILTTEQVYAGFHESILKGFSEAGKAVGDAYGALFTGSFGSPVKIFNALFSPTAQQLKISNPAQYVKDVRLAFNPILESLVASTPYIFTGLALALGFRAGVLNIGAEGQVYIGAVFGTFVAYSIYGIPSYVHIPLALAAAALGGGIWGFIPGWLKAKTGAHEVINCIMMNYIAFRLSEYLLTGPMKRLGSANPVSPTIQESAMLPKLFGYPIRFHIGFFIALALAVAVYFFLFKTTWGFNLRTVGSNPNAGKYAGMSVSQNIILAMALSGAMAGLAGANDVLGVNHNLAQSFSSGYGFDSIALALLGNSHPAGVVLAALLFGSLRSGATNMQLAANIPPDIISILQAVILIFIAAPAMIRTLYRIKEPSKEPQLATEER